MRTRRLSRWLLGVVLCAALVATGCDKPVASTPAASADPADGDGIPVFPSTEPVGLPAVPFRLTERSGETLDTASLKGRVWVVSFFFTSCPGPCLKLNQAIERLQRDLADKDVTFVSITVDPTTDTPERLRQYAENFKFAPEKWLFLTGDENEIHRISAEVFRLYADRAAHSEKLILIDQNGTIQGYYHGLTDADTLALKLRIDRLLNPKASEEAEAKAASAAPVGAIGQIPWRRLPAVNAALNATAGVLLVVGRQLIRRGRERAHRNVMLTAFAVSVVFLLCYLTYHQLLKVNTGAHGVAFTGPSPVREVYYGLLISHVVLAALVPILALRTIYLGLRDRREAHRRIARWTYPIWLYVSVTGVVIYVMLYQVYPPAG